MLTAVGGYSIELGEEGGPASGWPALQVQLLQEGVQGDPVVHEVVAQEQEGGVLEGQGQAPALLSPLVSAPAPITLPVCL